MKVGFHCRMFSSLFSVHSFLSNYLTLIITWELGCSLSFPRGSPGQGWRSVRDHSTTRSFSRWWKHYWIIPLLFVPILIWSNSSEFKRSSAVWQSKEYFLRTEIFLTRYLPGFVTARPEIPLISTRQTEEWDCYLCRLADALLSSREWGNHGVAVNAWSISR